MAPRDARFEMTEGYVRDMFRLCGMPSDADDRRVARHMATRIMRLMSEARTLYQFSLIRTDGPNRACRET
jgi:hypothetical protein